MRGQGLAAAAQAIEDGVDADGELQGRGRLAGGLLGGMHFSDSGTLKLPEPLKTPR